MLKSGIDPSTMERAGRLIAKGKLFADCITPEDILRAAWASAVGKKIAVHSRVAGMVRERLIVEVDDAVWQRQLFTLRSHILRRLAEVSGVEFARELELRVAPPLPKRTPPKGPPLPLLDAADEAERIANNGLRLLYRKARKRATA
ncbi:MAG: DUF721 domain-containing protein [Bryobacteraceae bacterium]|nr:DUF721 domain-containing protein [Bryobacteraceae bacterium]